MWWHRDNELVVFCAIWSGTIALYNFYYKTRSTQIILSSSSTLILFYEWILFDEWMTNGVFQEWRNKNSDVIYNSKLLPFGKLVRSLDEDILEKLNQTERLLIGM